eukprot:CAMPEP_0181327352 /NCGR_PEP_ID=MMETSP1101-20121128/22052_1 /TAXON_ID=46948 /ORGANISM="Rhodomonas abbreviata, Strain Caron Lab Isolate" /LENGTH=396 /DNA_ID=CAMNT_0023435999 /DNA_START=114 /DNA_END=1300 /DNA_ORIENTATION=+
MNAIVLAGNLLDGGDGLRLDMERLMYSVRQCIEAGLEAEAVAELTSIQYIAAKFHGGLGIQLMAEYYDAIVSFPGSCKRLKIAQGFVGRHLPSLRKPPVPSLPFQLALQEPNDSDIYHSVVPFQDSFMRVLWKAKPQKASPCTLRINDQYCVFAATCSPDGAKIAAGGKDKVIRLYNARTGERIATSGCHDGTGQCKCSADEADCSLAVPNPVCPVRGHHGNVNVLCWSPDGSMVLSGSSDKSLKVWDGDMLSEMDSTLMHPGEVTCIAWTRDGRTVLSGCSDGLLREWDATKNFSLLRELAGHSDRVRCVAVSPDSKVALSGSSDRSLRLWSIRSSKASSKTIHEHAAPVSSVAWSGDGRVVVSGSVDQTVKIWRVGATVWSLGATDLSLAQTVA